jgi:toxin ParE1/3/4
VKVVWTALARERLRGEAAHIAHARPLAAREWLVGIRKAVDRLRTYPFSGRPIPELPNTPRREIVHGAYRVIYEVRSNGVYILTVRHSRQLVSEDELIGDEE